jgi:hypothetical protein
LLNQADLRGQDLKLSWSRADLRDVDNITAIKEISPKLARIPKRISSSTQVAPSTVQAAELSDQRAVQYALAKLADLVPRRSPRALPRPGADAARRRALHCVDVHVRAEREPTRRRRREKWVPRLNPSPRTDWVGLARDRSPVTMKTHQHCLRSLASPSISASVSATKADLERLHGRDVPRHRQGENPLASRQT